jgi:hypothetical protein
MSSHSSATGLNEMFVKTNYCQQEKIIACGAVIYCMK